MAIFKKVKKRKKYITSKRYEVNLITSIRKPSILAKNVFIPNMRFCLCKRFLFSDSI